MLHPGAGRTGAYGCLGRCRRTCLSSPTFQTILSQRLFNPKLPTIAAGAHFHVTSRLLQNANLPDFSLVSPSGKELYSRRAYDVDVAAIRPGQVRGTKDPGTGTQRWYRARMNVIDRVWPGRYNVAYENNWELVIKDSQQYVFIPSRACLDGLKEAYTWIQIGLVEREHYRIRETLKIVRKVLETTLHYYKQPESRDVPLKLKKNTEDLLVELDEFQELIDKEESYSEKALRKMREVYYHRILAI